MKDSHEIFEDVDRWKLDFQWTSLSLKHITDLAISGDVDSMRELYRREFEKQGGGKQSG